MFNFNNVEASKPTTLLQKNSFKKDLLRILIKFLVISYNLRIRLFYRTYFMTAFEIGKKTDEKY